MDARWQRVEQIFTAAERLPKDARTALLDDLCAGDEDLRCEIESLLAYHDKSDEFIEHAVGGFALEEPSALGANSETECVPGILDVVQVGPYRILRQIGSGGMGILYEAIREDQFQKRVALKVIKRGMDTASIIRRFHRERQILAGLNHANITALLDGGTTADGRPYFVMEYVEGQPVTEFCDAHHLTIRQRLEIFRDICGAVQYAHQNLVVHRDLKPGNILIKRDGVPKLLDFGIAKILNLEVTSRTLDMTAAATRMMTPEYASPEQVRGEPVTTSTDVYSLGVLLYELLTRHRPYRFNTRTAQEIAQVICEQQPEKPSVVVMGVEQEPADQGYKMLTPEGVSATREGQPTQLRKRLRGDLDNIALKALHKEPSRRYTSVEQLSEDIRRYLIGLPVNARKDTFQYRARKFSRRHCAALVTTVAFLLVLLAATGVSVWQGIRANREAAVAQAVNDFLQNDLLAQASAATQSGPSAKPDPHLEVRTALDRAAARIAGKLDRQPEEGAAIRDTIGRTYIGLGLYPEARAQLERAAELHQRALGARNPKTLKTVSRLGETALLQGKYPEAEALIRQSLEGQRRVLGAEHPDTLGSMNSLASVYRYKGNYPQAEALFSQTLEIRRRVLGAEHPDTLGSMNNLAITYRLQGKYVQAETLYSQTLGIQRRVLGAEHPDTLGSMNNLADAYFSEGKYALAETLFSQTLEIKRRVIGAEHPGTLGSMNNLAQAYSVQGKYAQAEALHSQILEISRRVLGAEHPATLASMTNLAITYRWQGKYAQAEALHSQTLEIQRRVLGAEHPNTLGSMNNLANVYGDQGKHAQAEALQSQTLEIKRRVLGVEHPSTLGSMNNLADAYACEGKYALAETLYSQTLEIRRRVLGAEHPNTLKTLSDFAFMYQRQGKYGLAETEAAQGLAGRRHALGSDHPDTMISAADLALAYQSQGKFAESEALAREALEFNRKKQPNDWQRFRAESLLGASLAGQKKHVEAEHLLVEGYQGMAERKDHIAVRDWYHLDRAREWLIQLYQDWGKPKQAAEWQQKINAAKRPTGY